MPFSAGRGAGALTRALPERAAAAAASPGGKCLQQLYGQVCDCGVCRILEMIDGLARVILVATVLAWVVWIAETFTKIKVMVATV